MSTSEAAIRDEKTGTEKRAVSHSMTFEIKKPVDDVANAYIRHLDFCTEVGLVDRARTALDVASEYDLSGVPQLSEIYDKAAIWLLEAQRHETQYGQGSLLQRNHPKFRVAFELAMIRMASKQPTGRVPLSASSP